MELTFDTFQISSISLILAEYSSQISVDRLHSNCNSRADFMLTGTFSNSHNNRWKVKLSTNFNTVNSHDLPNRPVMTVCQLVVQLVIFVIG